MSASKVLYHYTSLEHLVEIIVSGRIKTGPSDLLTPKAYYLVNGRVICPETDDYKPVVWLTDSESPESMGLDGAHYSKKRIRISVPKKTCFKKWDKWADENNMEPQWKKAFARDLNWKSWYITESAISLDDVSEIRDLDSNATLRWR